MVIDVAPCSAFPRFNDAQMAEVAACGREQALADGAVLIEPGERDFPFFVIRSGEVEISEDSTGAPRTIAVHGPGEFTGDVDMLTGRPALFTARAKGPCVVIRVPAAELREALNDVPELGGMLLEAFQSRRALLKQLGFIGIRVVGPAKSRSTLAFQEFFYRNHVPHTLFDTSGPEGRAELAKLNASPDETPVIACHKHVLRRPPLDKIAECLGISRQVSDELFDLAIVGAGPAGLAASVYAGSEGLKTLVVDSVGPGGQAGASSMIENFMGFPSGISGADLANRGYLQALKFGAKFTAPTHVLGIARPDQEFALSLCTGQAARARSVLVATGVSYRQLDLDGCRELEGSGVYYAATSVEARVCHNSTAVVLGGGNSAGQAAMYLAEHARDVKIVIRGGDLHKSMSEYLCRRIELARNIEVLKHCEIVDAQGNGEIECVRLRNNETGQEQSIDCAALFIFIGAKPHTDWLPKEIKLDDKGYVLTGALVKDTGLWQESRDPCELETTLPGVLAAGDVRAGTTKRCGFAVGDGSLAVACVHRFPEQQVGQAPRA
jgi:thioredoxin reductase (NADPH)